MCRISLQKRKIFFENKLKEHVGKPKSLWKTLKFIDLPNKSGRCIICINQIVKHDKKSASKVFVQTYQ